MQKYVGGIQKSFLKSNTCITIRSISRKASFINKS